MILVCQYYRNGKILQLNNSYKLIIHVLKNAITLSLEPTSICSNISESSNLQCSCIRMHTFQRLVQFTVSTIPPFRIVHPFILMPLNHTLDTEYIMFLEHRCTFNFEIIQHLYNYSYFIINFTG